MSKMALSTLINECKKYVCRLDKCIQAIKTINQKNTYTTGFDLSAILQRVQASLYSSS